MAPKKIRRQKSITSAAGGHRSAAVPIFPDDVIPGHWESRVGGNLYQFKGPKEAFETKAVKEGLYLRVDMPGVPDDGAEVSLEGKELFFSGEAPEVVSFEEKRVYGGCIDLSSDTGVISEVKTVMKNGVLRIVLVGCGIQPDLSDREPLWCRDLPSKSRASQSSNPPRRELGIVGDCIVGYRHYTFLDPPDQRSCGLYPFQLGGPTESCQMKMLEGERLFMRVDMPDVPSQGLSVKTRDNKVFWGGEGVKGSEHDEETRGYFGSNTQNCGCCNYAILKSEVKYGIFRILIQLEKFKTVSCSAGATARKL